MNPQRPWRRAALWMAGLALSTLLGASAHAVSSTVVLSQVYGGGGSASSVIKNDYIELHNVSGGDISVDGWSVQYASATGSSWAVAPLTGSISSGGYLLVKLGTAGTGGADLTGEDVTGPTTMNLSGSQGKVALVNSTTALSGTCPSDGSIVDMLGYSGTTAASCSEGSPATGMSVSKALFRGDNGCLDSDSNITDFSALDPAPRNSQSTVVKCSTDTPPVVTGVTFNPTSVDPGGSATISATVTEGTSAVTSVTADLTAIGGTTATLSNGGSGTTYSASINVASGTPAGDKTITVTATDAKSKTASASGVLTVNYTGGVLNVKQARQQPLKSAFTVRGIVTSIHSGNAYIQDPDSIPGGEGLLIFDGSTISGVEPLQLGQDVSFSGTLDTFGNEFEFVVTAPPTDLTTYSENNALPATKTVTVPQVTGNDTYESQLVRIPGLTVVTAPGKISATGNSVTFVVQDVDGNQIGVYLHRNATAGATTPYPGAPANPIPAAVAADNSITFPDIKLGDIYTISGPLGERNPPSGGGPVKLLRLEDAGSLVLTGRNVIVATSATPKLVERGSSVTLSVQTFPATGSTVTADLSGIGGSASQALAWNGSDAYTATVTVSGGAPLGPTSIPVTASNPANSGGTPVTGQIALTITTPVVNATTIAEARALPEWTKVSVSGEVTAFTTGTTQIYFQDATGGVYMFGASSGFAANYGDQVTVTGLRRTFNGSVEIDYSDLYDLVNNPRTTGFGAPTITPKNITEAQWPANPGILTQTNSLYIIKEISGAGTGNKAFAVTDGTSTGELFIHALAGFGTTDYPAVGSSVNVVGIVDRYESGARNTWQIKPRQVSDITTGAAPAVIPAQMVFSTEPGGAQPGQAFATQPVVTVQTAAGQTATTYNGPVTLAIQSGTGTTGAVLSGTTTVTAVNGVATFSGLAIDLAGQGYALTASVYGLPDQASAAFEVGTPAVPGDVDKSGAVTLDDVRLALQIAGGLLSGTDASVSFPNADIDKNGSVTVEDAVSIRKLIP